MLTLFLSFSVELFFWQLLSYLRRGICGESPSFFFCIHNNANTMKLPAATWVRQKLFLSYYFTKKRPSKIFKIEKYNRQTHNKNALIFTK